MQLNSNVLLKDHAIASLIIIIIEKCNLAHNRKRK